MAENDKAAASGAAAGASSRRGLTKTGLVTSNKMQKSVVVTVETLKPHPRYGRTVRRSVKFMAHDPEGRCALGDQVVIVESRPLSRHKRWRVLRVLGKGGARAAETA